MLICDLVMLSIFLWDHFVYGLDLLFLIIPLALIGLWLIFFCIFPETYRFAEEELYIIRKFQKTVAISYASVFNFDAVSRDGFINLLRSNQVKVYYTQEKKRRAFICTPQDVEGFVETLKTNCPEFDLPEQEESRLNVFFENNLSRQSEKEKQDE